MATDFHTLIDRNKRNSMLLIALFVLFVALLGGIIGYAIGYPRAGAEHAWRPALIGISVTTVMAVVGAMGSYFGGTAAILSMSNAELLDRQDDPQLYNVVEEMSIAAGVPVPKVYLIRDSAPNAFATGRDPEHGIVAVTTGLREKLSRDELQAVIAHEISHIKHYDIRFALLMATLVGVVVLICDAILESLRHGRSWRHARFRPSKRNKGDAAVAVLLFLLVIVLAMVAPTIARIIEMAFSRQREYLADAGAIELTRNPDGLAGALSRIHADPDVLDVANRATAPLYIVHPIKHFEGRASSIMDSHPPIKDRIRRILAVKHG